MNLKDYLKARDLKAYEFAREAGVKFETIYRLARGDNVNLHTVTIRKIILASGGKIALETLI